MYKVVVLGTSWGGLQAMEVILSGLPSGFSLPIVAVQHRAKDSDGGLPTMLQSYCKLKIEEPEDMAPLLPGHVYVAPPDYHTLIDEGHISLSTDEPRAFSRPSIDVLFESAADVYGSGVVGVVLTGANQDGTMGSKRIKQRGGYLIAQDPSGAEMPTMPASVIASGVVDAIVPLNEIAARLTELSLGSGARAPMGRRL